MTYDEFIDKYGDVEVTFYSYYKYSFIFHTVLDGVDIRIGIGGETAYDIYKRKVNTYPIKISKLYPSWAKIDGKLFRF
jgi:hypothetical protein